MLGGVVLKVASYPALDVASGDPEIVLAIADDFSPTAAQPRTDTLRVFFARASDRDAAAAALRAACPAAAVSSLDVDDEDWARRSQENLPPVTVGRVTIMSGLGTGDSGPGTEDRRLTTEDRRLTTEDRRLTTDDRRLTTDDRRLTTVVVAPSMGFGTGHHASTRLCLAALQTIDLRGKRMLDIGTGSGILAIAAVALGATSAFGIDNDPDAIASARANLALNPAIRDVAFDVVDLTIAACAPSDIVAANLTGALLVRAAAQLRAAVAPKGMLVVSGLMVDEEPSVQTAFGDAQLVWRGAEDEWVGLAFNFGAASGV